MYKLFLFCTLILVSVCTPRTPRIYNVLISTKKNLSPSHALPVYEPVLRTTSLGLAFPPLIYQHTPIYQNIPNIQPNGVLNDRPLLQAAVNKPPSHLNGQRGEAALGGESLQQPLAGQYVPYNFNPYLGNFENYAPKEQLQREPPKNFEKYYENANDPKNVIANLKKNPEIPDVPPPALPVKN